MIPIKHMHRDVIYNRCLMIELILLSHGSLLDVADLLVTLKIFRLMSKTLYTHDS